MTTPRAAIRRLAPAVLLALAGACATAPARAPAPIAERPVWPQPPAAPRARWASEFPGSAEAPRPPWYRRAWDAFLGVESRERAAPALTQPFGIALDPEPARLVVADPVAAQVVLVDLARGQSAPLACEGRPWSSPIAVAVDGDGTRFVADAGSAVVVRVPRHGRCAVLGEGRLERPTGLALAAGQVFVVDAPRHVVVAFAADGTEAARFGGRGEGPGQLNFPTAIAAAPDGTLLVVDALNFRVARFSTSGAWVGSFGGPDEAQGGLVRPKAVAAGDDGRVYVSDAEQDAVAVFDAAGALQFRLGDPGGGPGELSMPAGLAVRGARLYVADARNGRIQVYELLGGAS